MSAQLAPIHEQLFWKMHIVNARIKVMIIEAINRWGSAAEEAQWMAWEEYGKPLSPDIPLADVIDTQDIHGWLLRRLTLVESREAAFVMYLAERVGEEAFKLGEEVYFQDGQRIGLQEKGEIGQISSPEELYYSLYKYLLNGMPCDNVDEVIERNEKIYRWKKHFFPQRKTWERLHIDSAKMEKMYTEWARGFFGVFEPEFETIIEDCVNGEVYLTFKKV
jgi:hypothetical protein